MRKIESKEINEKKKSRSNMIIGLLLVGLMILSTASYAFYREDNNDKNEKVKYNGLEFIKINNIWILQIENQEFGFNYLPNETLDISFNLDKKLTDFYNKPLYFSQTNAASQEILMNIGRYIERTQLACIDEDECEEDMPIKNCSDNFIIFKEEDLNQISQEENCIYIISKAEDEIRTADAFLYRLLGII